MKKLLAAAVLAATFVAPSTQAAEMNVAVIKGVPTIYVGGDIVTGDADKFMRLTARFPAGKSAVVLNSPGGLIGEGINIGLMVREKRMVTVVFNECASMCGLIWLAGFPRYVSTEASIGFHAVRRGEEDKSVSSSGNALVGGYLMKLGFGWRAISYLTETNPDSMAWLNGAKAKELGIAANVIDTSTTKTSRK
jgi:hypothetical protein